MKLRRMAVGLAAALAAGLTTACAPPDPIGSVDWATGGLNSISVAGWTVDPDGGETPIALHVYVDGLSPLEWWDFGERWSTRR